MDTRGGSWRNRRAHQGAGLPGDRGLEPPALGLPAAARSGAAAFVRCDHTDTAHCEAAVRLASERFGKLDILFANAGTAYFGALGRLSDAEMERVIAINRYGAFRISRAALQPAL